MELRIKENSTFAKWAAWKLNSHHMAMVLGNTIHLHNTPKSQFLLNRRWVQHELVHVQQFRRYGFTGFLLRYLWESIKNGYFNNKFEVEARKGETLDHAGLQYLLDELR